MTLAELYPLIKSLWHVWFMALFVGIVIWAFWPTRKARLEQHGSIPLRHED